MKTAGHISSNGLMSKWNLEEGDRWEESLKLACAAHLGEGEQSQMRGHLRTARPPAQSRSGLLHTDMGLWVDYTQGHGFHTVHQQGEGPKPALNLDRRRALTFRSLYKWV